MYSPVRFHCGKKRLNCMKYEIKKKKNRQANVQFMVWLRSLYVNKIIVLMVNICPHVAIAHIR